VASSQGVKDALANLWHDVSGMNDSGLLRRCVSSDDAMNTRVVGVPSGSLSPAAERMRQYRKRHRKGLRCVPGGRFLLGDLPALILHLAAGEAHVRIVSEAGRESIGEETRIAINVANRATRSRLVVRN
jgi:hypothetical protein